MLNNSVEVLQVSEAEFDKDDATGKMSAKFVLIRAGRAINPRNYRPAALQKAVQEGTYNGMRMFVDHGDKPPLKRSLREMVSAVESTDWDPSIGKQGGIRGTAEIFDPKFFDYASRAKKYMGVSANHQIQVQYVKEGAQTIQDVVGIPQAYSVDWVLYPSAGGEILSFARESEGEDQVEWSDITLDTLKANAPQLVEQLTAELKPAAEAIVAPVVTADQISAMVRQGVQEAVAEMAKKDEQRDIAATEIRKHISKSGLPPRVQTRLIGMFADALEYVEADIKAAVDDAKEELKELGVGPAITGEGPTSTSTGGKPTVAQAREGVESVFGFKPTK